MALNAGVAGRQRIHLRGIQDIALRGVGDVFAARSVASLAAYVPLRNLLRMDVIADGVAAIAGRAGRTLHVVVGVEGCPPVSPLSHFVRTPGSVGNVPLRGKREVIVANFSEVALLPKAAVDEGNLVFRELCDSVCGQVRSDGLGMLARVAYYVRHRRLLPARVDLLMAFFAALRTGVVS